MFCWGNTVSGQLGLGGIEEEHILHPRFLQWNTAETLNHESFGRQIKQIGCGEDHSVFLTFSGAVFTCGSNDVGQLGRSSQNRKRPEQVDALQTQVITQVTCGNKHSIAVNEWGQVFSWGCNRSGELGLGVTDEIIAEPRLLKSLATKQVTQVACGANHSLALLNNGQLYSWGDNNYGQLGLGTNVPRVNKPQLVEYLESFPIVQITCGGNHSMALSQMGSVYGWGCNNSGQLGVNDSISHSFPVLLKTLRTQRVRYMACGKDHTAILTESGGVFTFGGGTYGQLGHGVKTNEILPRKVLELMGTTISQLACGRCHTTVYNVVNNRIYAFGLGGSGQLGVGNSNANVPIEVCGPWVSSKNNSSINKALITISSEENKLVIPSNELKIKRIYCGGDQSFVTVFYANSNMESDDCRFISSANQILSLDLKMANACVQVQRNDSVSQDLMTYLETVFASSACINGSFLDENVNNRFYCNSKNSGVDFSKVKEFFEILSLVSNSVINELILNCVTQDLLPGLRQNVSDAEMLRLYLILPKYVPFSNPEYCNMLSIPFGQALLSLKPEADKYIENWWMYLDVAEFNFLIKTYKDCVVHILNQPESRIAVENKMRLRGLTVSFQMLQKCNKVNKDRTSFMPYEVFYIPEITDKVDVRFDYLNWIHYRDRSNDNFFICKYPFVFDGQAKTLIMQTDAVLQMQNAMDVAYQQNISSLFLPIDPANPYLVLRVSRDNLVQDTLLQLQKCDKVDLKKPLKVIFYGEEAVDAGGVRKEFFMLLMKEIMDPKYGMFKEYEETRSIWFNEKSFEDEVMFHLIGLLCGLAIYNGNIISLPFPLVLYKKLLNEKTKTEDLKGLSPSVYKSLIQLIEYEDDDLEDVFMLKFEASLEAFGQVYNYDLINNGSSISVSRANKLDYVNLYIDFILNKIVEKQFRAFNEGFHKVCGGRVLELFHAQELMAMVVGNENFDWQELEKNTEYKGDFSKDHPTIVTFWEVFRDLTFEEKKKFLLFLTGYDRIPIFGMKCVKIFIQPTVGSEDFLPVAHTCFNLLDLPRYSSKAKLRKKLLQAIENTRGFGLV